MPRVVLEHLRSRTAPARRPATCGLGGGKPAATPTCCNVPSSSKQPQQQGPDHLAGLVHSVTGHDAVGGSLVLHLEQHALVRRYVPSTGLAISPSRPAPSNCWNQLRRDGPVGGIGVRWTGGPRRLPQRRREARSPLGQRPRAGILTAEREHVERDEAGRGLDGRAPHPRLGRMDALEQRIEVQSLAIALDDDDLPVDARTAPAVRRVGGRPAPGSSGSAAVRCGCRAPPRRRRGTRCSETRPTSARDPPHPSPSGSAVPSALASIGHDRRRHGETHTGSMAHRTGARTGGNQRRSPDVSSRSHAHGHQRRGRSWRHRCPLAASLTTALAVAVGGGLAVGLLVHGGLTGAGRDRGPPPSPRRPSPIPVPGRRPRGASRSRRSAWSAARPI